MRLGVPKNLARGAGVDEGLQDEPMRRVFRAGVELAVGKRPCASEPELDIRFRVKLPGRLEARHRLAAPTCILSALDEERFESGLGERERGEKAGAAGSDDDGPGVRGPCAPERLGEGGLVRIDGADSPTGALVKALERCRFVEVAGELETDAQGEADVAPLARVDGLAVQGGAEDVGSLDPEKPAGFSGADLEAALLVGALVEGAGNLGDLKHGAAPWGDANRGARSAR